MSNQKFDVPDGELTVAYGPMFAGKSDFLIRVVRRWGYRNIRYSVFKHAIDTRYDNGKFISNHDKMQIPAIPVSGAKEIAKRFFKTSSKHIIIDEAQFFDDDLIDLIKCLEKKGYTIVVGGLNLDFRDEPFGPMPQIINRATNPVPLFAVCRHGKGDNICGELATKTQRLVNGIPADYSDPVVLVGAKESYEPRCAKHHKVPGKPKGKLEK